MFKAIKDFWIQDIKWSSVLKPINFIIEIFVLVIIVCVVLLPVLGINFIEDILNIEYNKYIELLNIILNSNYIWMVGILIVIFWFRKELSEKLLQISKLKDVEFNGQAEKMHNNGHSNSTNTVIEENQEDEINENIKKEFSSSTTLRNVENENIDELKEQKNKLMLENTRLKMANTTEFVLKSAYIDSKLFKQISINDVERYVKKFQKLKRSTHTKIEISEEVRAILLFLTASGILESEDDEVYEITDFGRMFIRYIFEGGI